MGLKGKQQVTKNHTFKASLRHALDGLLTLVKSERNFRFHCCMAVLVVGGAWWLQVSLAGWLWLLLAISLVLLAEAANSIVERVVDLLVDHHFNELAKQAKDMAAGVVLITALLALLIGLCVFGPLLF